MKPLVSAFVVFACLAAFVLSIEPALLSWLLLRIWVFALALAPGAALVAACAGFGIWLMPRKGATGLEIAVLGFASGIGVVSSLAFIAGVAGQLVGAGPLMVIAAGLLLGALWLRWNLSDRIPAAALAKRCIFRIRAVDIPTVLLLTTAMILIGVVALTPPLIFDVTEYHLGAWTTYLDSGGRFVPMPFNFYARFPFPIESIYFLGLGSTLQVDTAPKLFNAACVIACGLLAWLFARRLGATPPSSAVAALLALTHPVMLDVSIDAMIDAPVALLVAGGFYAGWRTFDDADSTSEGWVVPALVLFGTALAAKYTVAQLYLLPWLLLIFAPLFRGNWRRRPGLLVAACAAGAVPCALWLGKNMAWYGNPLEPFFQHIFQPRDSSAAAREAFYTESHFPQSPLSLDYWATLLPRLREFGWVMLVASGCWAFRSHRRAAARMALFAAMAYLSWNLVRNSENRFLLPLFVMVSALAVSGVSAIPVRGVRWLAMATLLLFSASNITTLALRLHESDAVNYLLNFAPTTPRTPVAANAEPTPREDFLVTNLGDLGRAINQINRELPNTARLLLIYEARPYLFRPHTVYNVVWDDSVLLDLIRHANSADEALEALRRAGITHVLVNRQELLRYIQQYARRKQLLRLGVASGADPRAAWGATQHPEDLYPPFYRDRDWERLRPVVYDLLDRFDSRAKVRHGAPPRGISKPLDITVSPL